MKLTSKVPLFVLFERSILSSFLYYPFFLNNGRIRRGSVSLRYFNYRENKKNKAGNRGLLGFIWPREIWWILIFFFSFCFVWASVQHWFREKRWQMQIVLREWIPILLHWGVIDAWVLIDFPNGWISYSTNVIDGWVFSEFGGLGLQRCY
jgi:hypothetical protein